METELASARGHIKNARNQVKGFRHRFVHRDGDDPAEVATVENAEYVLDELNAALEAIEG